jgi:hypothetical protein
LVLFSVLPYAETRHYGHVFDDHVIRGEGSLAEDGRADLGTIWRADFFGTYDRPRGQTGFWRPLVLLSFRAEVLLSGGSRSGYLWLGHVVTVLCHLAACLALWRLLLALGVGPTTAWLAALLFAVHPVHVETVTWTSGRAASAPAALAWAGTALWLAGRGAGRRALWGAVLMGCALLCKETSVLLLGLASLVGLCQGLSWRRALAGPGLALLGVLLLRGLFFGFGSGFPEEAFTGPPTALARWLTWLSILPDLGRLAFWPGPGTPIHPVLAANSWSDPGVMAGVCFLLLLCTAVCLAWRARSRPAVYATGLALGLVFVLAPWLRFPSSFPEVAGPLYERYLYAASAAPCLLVAYGLARLAGKRVVPVLALGLVLAGSLTPVTAKRAAVWASNESLARAGLRRAPASPDLWAMLGTSRLDALQQTGDRNAGGEALQAFDRVLTLDPGHQRAAVNRFITATLMGAPEEQLWADAAGLLRDGPDAPLVLHNLGAWHQAEGRHDEALALFAKELGTGRAHPETRSMMDVSLRAIAEKDG